MCNYAALHEVAAFKREVNAGEALFDPIATPPHAICAGNGDVRYNRGLAAAWRPKPTRHLAARHNVFDIPLFGLRFLEIAVERKRQRFKLAARTAAFLLLPANLIAAVKTVIGL